MTFRQEILRSFSITVEQSNHCGLIQSKCTNDVNNSPSSGSQINICFNGSTCANSGSNNLNQCFNGSIVYLIPETLKCGQLEPLLLQWGVRHSTFCEPGKSPVVRP